MAKRRVPALPDSPSFQQLWEALGSKLMDAAQGKLPSKQARVRVPSPAPQIRIMGPEEEFCLIFLRLCSPAVDDLSPFNFSLP